MPRVKHPWPTRPSARGLEVLLPSGRWVSRQRAWQLLRLAAACCVQCGQPSGGSARCPRHRERDRLGQVARRARGRA
jgi:hypothetical protein